MVIKYSFAYVIILLFYHTFGRKEAWQIMGMFRHPPVSERFLDIPLGCN